MTAPQSGTEQSRFSAAADLLTRWPAATLFLVCALAWLPGFFSLPPLDRDESRFAQASKQMIETGDYVDIRYSTQARYQKPVGIYWLQSAATRIAGAPPYNVIWTYRIPSLIGGFIAVLLAYWIARAFAPPPTALLGAGLLALCVSLSAEVRIAKTDAVLLATVLGAQGFLLRTYLAERLAKPPPSVGIAMAGWFAIAVGILIKGPVILAVIGVTIVALAIWDREAKWLRGLHWLAGLAVVAVVVSPWLVAIALATHGAFFQQSLGHDLASKVMGGQESHGAPPGYYLLLSSATLWPATLLVLPGIGLAVARRKDPAMRYLLAWAGAVWILFELTPTKLPHYILPAYPALALLGAVWAMQPAGNEPRWERNLRWIAAAQFVVAVAAFVAFAILAPKNFGGGIEIVVATVAAIGGLIGLAAAIALLQRQTIVAVSAAAISAIVFYAVAMWGVAPRVGDIWMSPKAATLVAKDRLPDDPPVVLAGYVEPSLVFLLGTDTLIDNSREAADAAAQQGGLVLVEDAARGKFFTELGARAALARPLDDLKGFDYSRGRREHITIYRVTPSQQATEPPQE